MYILRVSKFFYENIKYVCRLRIEIYIYLYDKNNYLGHKGPIVTTYLWFSEVQTSLLCHRRKGLEDARKQVRKKNRWITPQNGNRILVIPRSLHTNRRHHILTKIRLNTFTEIFRSNLSLFINPSIIQLVPFFTTYEFCPFVVSPVSLLLTDVLSRLPTVRTAFASSEVPIFEVLPFLVKLEQIMRQDPDGSCHAHV